MTSTTQDLIFVALVLTGCAFLWVVGSMQIQEHSYQLERQMSEIRAL